MGFQEDRLAALDADFKAAKAPQQQDGNWLPEDGEYQVIVERWDTFENKNKTALFLKAFLKISLDPTHEGRVIEKVWPIFDQGWDAKARESKLGWLKKDLVTMGLDPEAEDFSFGNLLKELEKTLDVPLAVAVKTSITTNPNTGQPYRNLYINDRLGGPVVSDIPSDIPPAPVGASDGSDHPFDDDSIEF